MDAGRAAGRGRRKKALWIGAGAACAALLLLPILFRPDGNPHQDWQQFLGRFHPLFIHIPIGLVLLIPVLEIAGRSRPALRETAALLLPWGAASCMLAAALGFLLAYGSGEAGAGVTRHMWGGIALTIGVSLCALVRPAWAQGRAPSLYPALLGCVLLLLLWVGHQGGSLTHGGDYLTRYLPSPLRHLSLFTEGKPATRVSPNAFYAKYVDPIFDSNCVVCHGASKVKGGLRLDTYELLMEGGKHGAVVIPGNPQKSELIVRVTLSPDHKRFMPAEGKPPLKPEEIALLKAWVQQGASPAATVLAGVALPRVRRETVLPQVGDYSRLRPALDRLNQADSGLLLPVSRRPGDGLILNAAGVAADFNDASLARLGPFAPYIVVAELSHTRVTDASIGAIAEFKNLRELHLDYTNITGAGLAQLSALHDLAYLNLSGSRVTKQAVAPLTGMKQLRHLYLFDTPAQPIAAAPGDAGRH